MDESLLFLFRYFWLFTSITIISIGDTLFIMNAIQDFNKTLSIYKENKDRSYLKGKFTPQVICIIINIMIILVLVSLLFYASEIVEMRKILGQK